MSKRPQTTNDKAAELIEAKTIRPVVRDAHGHFMPGSRGIGGRKRGSYDGIKTVRQLVGRVLEEIGAPKAALEQFFDKIKAKGPEGAWWLYEKLYEPHAAREKPTGEMQPTKIVIEIGDGRE